jgi:hypothetical protein
MKVEITSQLVEIICKVNSHFKDYSRTKLWLNLGNASFGYISPVDLIARKRAGKVLELINSNELEFGEDIKAANRIAELESLAFTANKFANETMNESADRFHRIQELEKKISDLEKGHLVLNQALHESTEREVVLRDKIEQLKKYER